MAADITHNDAQIEVAPSAEASPGFFRRTWNVVKTFGKDIAGFDGEGRITKAVALGATVFATPGGSVTGPLAAIAKYSYDTSDGKAELPEVDKAGLAKVALAAGSAALAAKGKGGRERLVDGINAGAKAAADHANNPDKTDINQEVRVRARKLLKDSGVKPENAKEIGHHAGSFANTYVKGPAKGQNGSAGPNNGGAAHR